MYVLRNKNLYVNDDVNVKDHQQQDCNISLLMYKPHSFKREIDLAIRNFLDIAGRWEGTRI